MCPFLSKFQKIVEDKGDWHAIDCEVRHDLATEQLNSNLCPIALYEEKAMAAHSSALAWKIPWTEEPGGLQSMGSQNVGDN